MAGGMAGLGLQMENGIFHNDIFHNSLVKTIRSGLAKQRYQISAIGPLTWLVKGVGRVTVIHYRLCVE